MPMDEHIVWRRAKSSEELVAFTSGKTILRIQSDRTDEAATYFTDGSAIRLTAENGTWYSDESGGDPPNIVWEIGEPSP